VKAEFDAGLLGDGDDLLEEVRQRLEDVLVALLRGLDGGPALHLGVIVPRRERSTAQFVVGLGARQRTPAIQS